MEIPTDSCHVFCTLGNPCATPMVTRGEGSFSYQGVSTRGVPGCFSHTLERRARSVRGTPPDTSCDPLISGTLSRTLGPEAPVRLPQAERTVLLFMPRSLTPPQKLNPDLCHLGSGSAAVLSYCATLVAIVSRTSFVLHLWGVIAQAPRDMLQNRVSQRCACEKLI